MLCLLCLPGIVAIGIALDRRRSAIRYPLLVQAVALAAWFGEPAPAVA